MEVILNETLDMDKNTTAISQDLPSCDDSVLIGRWEFLLASLLSAIVFLVILALMKRRINPSTRVSCARFGIVYPVDMLMDTDRRRAYTAVFVLLSYRALKIVDGERYVRLPYTTSQELHDLLNILVLCLAFFPLLSCIGLRRHVVANLIGLLYLTPWVVDVVWSDIIRYSSCLKHTDVQRVADGLIELIADIPQYVCCIILLCCYVTDLVTNCKYFLKGSYQRPKHRYRLHRQHHYRYVLTLLNPQPGQLDTHNSSCLFGIWRNFRRIFCGPTIPGFRISSRMACTIICTAFFVLYLGVKAIIVLEKVLYPIVADPQFVLVTELIRGVNSSGGNDTNQIHREIATLYRASSLVGVVLSMLIQFVFMIRILHSYRMDMAKLRRGDHSFHYAEYKSSSPAAKLIQHSTYSGYQIAFTVCAFILTAFVFAVIVFFIGNWIIFSILHSEMSNFLNMLKNQWPTILVTMIGYIIQILLIKFFLLQQRGYYLNINNRRLYHIYSYYVFFFNVIVGFFSCIQRILMSFLFGLIMVSRLDIPMAMRGYEQNDPGYNAYLGLLYVDHAHNNPVVHVFIQLLQEEWLTKNASDKGETNIQMRNRRKVLRNKWRLLFILVKNPSLLKERRPNKPRLHSDSSALMEKNGNLLDFIV